MKKIMEFTAHSEEDSRRFARQLADLLRANDIVLLEGDLGSGKTFLVKEICNYWQTQRPAASPTFSLIHHYAGPKPVYHVDLYRIEHPLELVNLGLEELWEQGAVTFIEWPQLLENQLEHYYKVRISITGTARFFEVWQKA